MLFVRMNCQVLVALASLSILLSRDAVICSTKYWLAQKIKPITHDEAAAFCSNLTGGYVLATIQNPTDQGLIATYTSNAVKQWVAGAGYWTGGRADAANSPYYWIANNCPFNYTNWAQPPYPMQPDYTGTGPPFCTRITWDGYWDDLSCSSAHTLQGAICEKTQYIDYTCSTTTSTTFSTTITTSPPLKTTTLKIATPPTTTASAVLGATRITTLPTATNARLSTTPFTTKYYAMKGAMTYGEAKARCSLNGDVLATIGCQDEQDMIRELTGEVTAAKPCNTPICGYLIGAQADAVGSHFNWITGSLPFSYTKWGGGEPDYQNNDSSQSPFCVRVADNGDWDDIGCSDARRLEGIICERAAQAQTTRCVTSTPTTTARTKLPTTIRTSATPTTTTTGPVKGITTALTAVVPTNATGAQVTDGEETTHFQSTMPIPWSVPSGTPNQLVVTGKPNLTCNGLQGIQDLYPKPTVMAKEETTDGYLTAHNILMKCCTDFSPLLNAPPNNGKPTKLTTVLAIDRLLDFSDVAGTLTISGFFHLKWQVTTCSASQCLPVVGNSLANGAATQRVYTASVNEVWLPKCFFTTSSNDIFMKGDQYEEDLLITLSPSAIPTTNLLLTLDFYYLKAGVFSTICPFDLTKFPFDSVTCDFTFTLAQSIGQLQITTLNKVCPLASLSLTEWTFVGCNFSDVGLVRQNGYDVSTVTLAVTLLRNPGYYLVNLGLPNLALFLLDLSTFLMPAYFPDRSIFSVTTLLSVMVAQASLTEQVPKVSGRILLNNVIFAMVGIMAVITFYHLFACRFTGCEGEGAASIEGKTSNEKSRRRKLIRKFDKLAFSFAVVASMAVAAYAIAVLRK